MSSVIKNVREMLGYFQKDYDYFSNNERYDFSMEESNIHVAT